MSVHKQRIRLTARAQRDYDDILLYTETTWGQEQTDRYDAAIDRGLEAIRSNPLIGRARDDVSRGLRGYLVERHVLYYRIREDVVEVVRILHQRVDPARHLRP